MTEKTFTEKLITVQCDLKAPKGQRNDFGKYNYRSAEDIVNAVKPLNKEQGLLLTLSDKMILIGDRYYVEATATITDGETSQNYTAYAREAAAKKGMDESQITGTASSYARKYALNGLYLIDDTKDADTNEYKQQENNVAEAELESYLLIKDRLTELGRKTSKPYEELKRYILGKINKQTNSNFQDFEPANFSDAIGVIKTLELKQQAKKEKQPEPQNKEFDWGN